MAQLISKCPRHKLKASCLTMVIAFSVSFFCTDVICQTKRLESGQVITVNVLDIEWQMHAKFNSSKTFTNSTALVAGYLRHEHKYDPQYVRAEKYGITIKAITQVKNVKQPLKYKWEIIGISKGDGSLSSYRKEYITDKTGLFAGSETFSQSDINPQYENIETLPHDGIYQIKITPFIVLKRIEQPQKTFKKTIRLKDHLVIALGDSFTSGEGNPDVEGETDDPILCDQIKVGILKNEVAGVFGFDDEFDMKEDAVWLEPEAHRSLYSPSAQLAQQLEDNDPHSVVTFLNFGTSGAQIIVGLLNPQHPNWQTTGQIREAKAAIANRKVDVVIMSIGINDIGVGGGGISSLIEGASTPSLDNYFDALKIDEVNLRLSQLTDKYTLLNNELKRYLNPSQVFLYEVPINMFRNAANEIEAGCGALRFINQSEASQLDRFGRKLLDKMVEACNKHKWKYIGGVVAEFKEHGYCEPSGSWFRAASTSCKIQGDINGTIHPNQAGHKKIAELAFPIVKEQLLKIKAETISTNITD